VGKSLLVGSWQEFVSVRSASDGREFGEAAIERR